MMVNKEISNSNKDKIKVLYINALYWGGGAEKITRQLYMGVRNYDISSFFMSGRYQNNVPKDVKIIYKNIIERILSVFVALQNHNFLYQTYISRKKIIRFIEKEKVDIVHFHNMHGNYFGPNDIEAIRKICPNIVITMHDMWMLTGCCPHGMQCKEWENGKNCKNCKGNEWLKKGVKSAENYLLCKKKSYSNKNIRFVSPSQWLIDCCFESYLKNENIHLIPNGVNTKVYRPLDKDKLREKYGIDRKKHVIMFAANNIEHPYKGFKYLCEALDRIKDKDNYCLLSVGNDLKEIEKMEYQIFVPGYIEDESVMNEMYALSDVYISTSVADTFPLVILESLAAGTPVIAFDTGGIPEAVSDKVGWIVEQRNVDSLVNVIERIFSNDIEYAIKQKKCREYIVDNLSEEIMLEKYVDLYHEIYEAKKNKS